MAGITKHTLVVISILLFVRCNGDKLIPDDITQVTSWFNSQVGGDGSGISSVETSVAAAPGISSVELSPSAAPVISSVEPSLAAAESKATVIKVRADGGGDFKTISDAVKSVPAGNQKRIIISIGPGNYTERVKVERNQPFITFHGDPKEPPVLVSDGTAFKYGTVDSATLIVEGDYFSAVNLNVVNSAPRPDGIMVGAQAVAFRISGDAASFYNCRFIGFQDTLCDDKGKHFFKDCYIEGTVDFIFGNGKSLYLNSEIHVIPGDKMALITAQARKNENEDTGFVFVHCKVTGGGPGVGYLGRSWFTHSFVVFAFSELGDVVQPAGWSDNKQPSTDATVYFGEYNNRGPGADFANRATFAKKLTDEEVKKFITLDFVDGAKWLLPPATV